MQVELGPLDRQQELEDLVVVHQGLVPENQVEGPRHRVVQGDAPPADEALLARVVAAVRHQHLDLARHLLVVLHDAPTRGQERLVDV